MALLTGLKRKPQPFHFQTLSVHFLSSNNHFKVSSILNVVMFFSGYQFVLEVFLHDGMEAGLDGRAAFPDRRHEPFESEYVHQRADLISDCGRGGLLSGEHSGTRGECAEVRHE